MPNTPALVGEAASAIARGTSASNDDIEIAQTLLGAVGKVTQVDDRLMDAVTGLSGSGPAYVYLMIEAMIEGGVREGLTYDSARLLAAQTVIGAAKMAISSSENIAQLRANVTTPGGTTICGVAALEKNGVRHAFMDAVAEASKKSREMSKKS
jgi:pyrroline-5-carboxylate reductase